MKPFARSICIAAVALVDIFILALPFGVGSAAVVTIRPADYGAVCDGRHNDTKAWLRAIRAADKIGATLVGSGTCVIGDLRLDSGITVVIDGRDQLRLLRAPGFTDTIFYSSGPDEPAARFSLSHTLVDGNFANQSNLYGSRAASIRIAADTYDFRHDDFIGSSRYAIWILQSSGHGLIADSQFHGTALHDPDRRNRTGDTSAILIDQYTTSATQMIEILRNRFTGPPSVRSPGASVSGVEVVAVHNDTDVHARVEGNSFYNMGQSVFGNRSGPVNFYRNCVGCKILSNTIINSAWYPISIQRSRDVEIAHNTIRGEANFDLSTGKAAISVFGRKPVRPMSGISVHDNDIADVPHLIGIAIAGDEGGEIRDVSLNGNTISGAAIGLFLSQVAGTVRLDGTRITTVRRLTARGLEVQQPGGRLHLVWHGGAITGARYAGILVKGQGQKRVSLDIEGVTFSDTGTHINSAPIVVGNVQNIHVKSCYFKGIVANAPILKAPQQVRRSMAGNVIEVVQE